MKGVKRLLELGMLVFSFVAIANDEAQLADLNDLLDSDKELGLQQIELYWNELEPNHKNIKADILMTTALIRNKRVDEADQILQKLVNLPKIKDTEEALILAQRLHVARISKSKNDFSELIKSADQLLKKLNPYSEQVEAAKSIYVLNRAIALKLYFEGSFASAEPYYHQALAHLEDGKYQLKSDLLDNIGVVKAQQADLAGGAEYMLRSIQVLESQQMPVQASRYQNLGSLNFMLKKWDKTIEFSEKALSMEGVKPAIRASLLSNIAAAYVEKDELNLAIEKLNQSIAISEQAGTNTSSARNNLGYIYNQVGEYEKALEQLEISKAELIKSGSEADLSVTYKSMADVYANMQQFDQAAALYEQAYEGHQSHDIKMKRVELYPKWIDVLVTTGDYKKAYELMVEFKTLNDEITDVVSTEKVNEVMAAYEVEKNQQALADSELARAQQQKSIISLNQRNELQNRIRTLMIIMVSALLLLLIFIFRSWRFRGKVNQVLLDKNQRIENQQNELVALNSQLKGQAEVDSLTGIHNRRYVTNKLAKIISQSKQTTKSWCLIIIDIDDFKTINDTYGHQRGDEILQQFATCLEGVRKSKDMIARWGGEEFLWLVEVQQIDEGTVCCDQFQKALSEISWFRSKEDTVTCSMGFSSFPLLDLNFEDWEAALRLADYALYQAKNSGKDCWAGFEVVDHQLGYSDIKDIDGLVQGKKLKVMKK